MPDRIGYRAEFQTQEGHIGLLNMMLKWANEHPRFEVSEIEATCQGAQAEARVTFREKEEFEL